MGAMDTEEQVQAAHANLNDPPSGAAFLQRTYPPLPPPLLHTSFIPSPDEEITIRESIHDIQTTLSSVDDEIARVRATLSALEEYRGTLHRTLMQRQSSLSPIRRLPPEIWGEIFLFASAGSLIKCGPRSATDKENIQFLLCQICSYWRTVAVSVPGLWSNIQLNLHTVLPLCPGFLHILRLCLARSKNEPLTLSFEDEVVIYPDVVEMLMAHSERWKDVSLISTMLFDRDSTLTQAKNLSVPNLRRLCIDTTHRYGNIPASSPFETFEDAPSLRELSLTEFMHPFQCVRIPWSQLTHFSSKRNIFGEGEFTLIMRHLSALVSFSTESERILEVASTAPVLLPHLRKLSITNKGSYISKTCQFLTTPNLEDLAISAVTPFVADQTVAMIKRSGCAPKQLTLRSSLEPGAVWDEHMNVVWLLAAVPSLACLELTVANAAVHILPQLANRARGRSPPTPPPTQRAPLLPALETLVLEDRLCSSAAAVTEVLEWRIVHGAAPGLRAIGLRLFPPASPKFDELDSFKRMAEGHGVDVSVFSG